MLKAQLTKLGDVITAEARELIGSTRYSEVFSGHLPHELASVDLGGLVHYQTPTLSPTCSWSKKISYVGPYKALQGVIVSSEGFDQAVSTVGA